MEGTVKDLSRYRFEKALNNIDAAELLLKEDQYDFSLNRSYYAVFDAMRAVLALDNFDSRKHSGVIAYFNLNYIKTGKFNRSLSLIIKEASSLREKSDYEDFYMATYEEAVEIFDKAKEFVNIVGQYLRERTNMINLTYYGHSCFVLDFDGYKVALDPYTGVPGYKELDILANEVLCSHGHGDHNYVEAVKLLGGARPTGLEVTEVQSFHDSKGGKLRGENTLRIFKYSGLSLMHCGDIGVMPTKEQLALMKDLDCVLIPVGGFFTMEPDECKAFLDEIKPRMIIPMHYREGSKGYDAIGTLDAFTNLYSGCEKIAGDSIEITGKNQGIYAFTKSR